MTTTSVENSSGKAFLLFLTTVLVTQILQHRVKRKKRESDDEIYFHHLYQVRRRKERMSYDDLDNFTEASLPRDAFGLQDQRTRRDLVDEYSPKNRNWCHFETCDDGLDVDSSEDEEEQASSSSEETFLWTDPYRKHRRLSLPPIEVRQPTWSARLKQSTLRPFWMLRKNLGSFVAGERDSLDWGPEGENPNFGPMRGEPYVGDEPFSKWNIPPNNAVSGRRYNSDPNLAYTGTHEGSERDSMDQQFHNRAARAQYNARIMPNKVVMIRHGQSLGNVNEALFSTTPDNAMPLTKLGWDQARKAGEVLKAKVLANGETVHFIVSPYVRTVETFHGIVSAWCDPAEFKSISDRDKRLKAWYGRLLELGLTWHEDPRIREQDFGNYQDPVSIKQSKRERHKFGIFFYRFPHGESASDVFDRVSTFLDSLWRSFDLNRSRNYVLVTHGISIRVLLARYFRYTIDQFSMLANPKNGEMVILCHDGAGRLQLEGRCEIDLVEKENGETAVSGYSFHKRLRVIPPQFCPKVKIRISYDD